ncbi:MAG: response regulator transcription factor [Candidatus Obscuribacterales bacterium]|jgi:DNA-binding response OmpR family regulator
MAKILIVEDDALLGRLMVDFLRAQHHEVEIACTGSQGWEKLNHSQYEVLVLDWQLPEIEGIEVLNRHRSAGGLTPVLMLTRKDSIDEKETGFRSGCDDYLTKPFEMRELAVRIQALLRRPLSAGTDQLVAGDLRLDLRAHTAFRGDDDLQLLPKEFALLAFFMRNPNLVFSAQALLDRVWNSEAEVSEEAVSICIRRLRKKVDHEGAASIVRTVHGLGYRFEP